MEGAAHKAVWIFLTLCLESVLTAFPTISVYSEIQSTGIPLEGIVVEAPDAFLWQNSDNSELWTAGPMDASWYSRLFEESSVAAVLQIPRGTGVPGPGDALGYIDPGWTEPVIVPAQTPADSPFTSSMAWMEMTTYSGDGSLRPSRRYSDPYR